MNATEKFKEDKSNFIFWLSLQAIISFLALSTLFGLFIVKSFENNVTMEQTATGNYYNNQEIHK